ncbi:kielin/chordin-like protein isoform X5 [Carassius gibelio]|uniref:kielin/chordin-like protein isoform X5 n=1 Tax=Carassius gibelio TaxID=101364 RepID=UPI002278558D|nr:kielin/chordin-like protein isoform X5 [Carassius gibelio]
MKLKALAGGLFLSLLVLWNVCDCVETHQDATETVINLLEALSITHTIPGITKVNGRDPKMAAWRFRSSRPHLKLPQTFLDYLFNTSQGVLGLHLVGSQRRGSEATLISFTSSTFQKNGDRPLLELVSNTKADWLQLEFRSADGLRPAVLKLPGGSPFTGRGWVRMALSVEPRQIVLYVDCQDAVVLKLKEGGRILTLDFPHDLQVTFSSTVGKKSSKFMGAWQTAELSTRAYERRPWFCDNVTDSLPDTVFRTSPTANYNLDMMLDQGDRGDGIVSATRYPIESNERLGQLENSLHNILTMLDMLRRQNTALQARVDYLETCECSKRKCVYEGREMDEGSRWSPDRSTVCYCTQGNVQCDRFNECSFHDNIYSNGDVFSTDDCNRCTCDHGRVECNVNPCPSQSCQQPPPPPQTTCCPVCQTRCEYEGEIYENGKQFVSRSNPCLKCSCSNGQVTCDPNQCPPPPRPTPERISEDCTSTCDVQQCPQTCQDGVKLSSGSCCTDCSRCNFEGQVILDGVSVQPIHDPCKRCVCNNGNINCVQNPPCPPTPCNNPVTRPGECCARCEECTHDGDVYADGQTFVSRQDPCSRCQCSGGQVSCESAISSCPSASCTHPTKPHDQCCPTCNTCEFEGRVYVNGEEFRPPGGGPCIQCLCQNGNVRCHQEKCPHLSCAVPTPARPNTCCPTCRGCTWNSFQYEEGATWTVSDQTCTCRDGQVTCIENLKVTPAPCPDHRGCTWNSFQYEEGATWTVADQTCSCRDGQVTCVENLKVTQAPCQDHRGCTWNSFQYEEGATWTVADQTCSCRDGQVTCVENLKVTQAPCQDHRGDDCCGDSCGQCQYKQYSYTNGQTFKDPEDPCVTCTCQNGFVHCEMKQCPQQCAHPVSMRDCCPVCDGCLFEGQRYRDSQTFYAPSDPCRGCVCQSSSVTCSPITCPQVSCQNPITLPGQCCPQCRGCFQRGQEYLEGDSLTLPNEPCIKCTCVDGEVNCVGPDCPKLTCMHQVTDPGSCCPRCRGCIYDGVEHLEGSTWFASRSPCMSCMCVNGVTTCSEVHCLSTCLNQISVPGECCPVCADCVYEGRVYGPGESFHPSDDPCQICTCEVMPDGKQHLRCYRKQCPSLVDCPKHNILYSGSDSCCPVCAQPLSNCTATLIGNEVLATDDPCFTCQCKDLTWTCIHRGCPPLSCPPAEQHTPPDSCCPICDDCVLEGNQYRVSNGQRWTDRDNECVTCICNQGHIECELQECPPLECPNGWIKVKSPGKCCPECTGIITVAYSKDAHAKCVYDGQWYNHNEHWQVDECTSCTCVYGDVHCQTQRCPTLTCASDETPALVPGMCCPHCIPRPATCIVFGDPHYRTFDGKMVNFQGKCTYVLAQDCSGGDFSVHVSNEDRGRKGVSWTKEVTVFIGDIVVQLFQDWIVKVDYQQVSLPFLKEPYVYLERKTNTILLNTNVGLKVLWNGRSHLEVSVPGTYKNHMCGLCGNFNNYPHDDMKLRNKQITNSEAVFGNDWKVGSENPSVQCPDAINILPCQEAGYSARKTANARCAVLKSPVFERCHKLVPPEMFFASCVYDLCACGSNIDECLCDVLEAYASECREAGVILQWRSPTLCAVGCPLDRGYVFDECGPPCPKTCFNKDVPLGVIESHCFKPCVPGCQCPAGLVEHNAHCIAPEKCPKIIHGNL